MNWQTEYGMRFWNLKFGTWIASCTIGSKILFKVLLVSAMQKYFHLFAFPESFLNHLRLLTRIIFSYNSGTICLQKDTLILSAKPSPFPPAGTIIRNRFPFEISSGSPHSFVSFPQSDLPLPPMQGPISLHSIAGIDTPSNAATRSFVVNVAVSFPWSKRTCRYYEISFNQGFSMRKSIAKWK